MAVRAAAMEAAAVIAEVATEAAASAGAGTMAEAAITVLQPVADIHILVWEAAAASQLAMAGLLRSGCRGPS